MTRQLNSADGSQMDIRIVDSDLGDEPVKLLPEIPVVKERTHVDDVSDITGRLKKHLDDMEDLYGDQNETEGDYLLEGATDYVDTMEAGETKYCMKNFLNKYRDVNAHVVQLNDERDQLFDSLADWFSDLTDDRIGATIDGNCNVDEILASDPNDQFLQTKVIFEKVRRLNDEICKLFKDGRSVVHLEREKVDLKRLAIASFRKIERKIDRKKADGELAKMSIDEWNNAHNEISQILQNKPAGPSTDDEDSRQMERLVNIMVKTLKKEKEINKETAALLKEKQLMLKATEEDNTVLTEEIAMFKSDIKRLERELRDFRRNYRLIQNALLAAEAREAGITPTTSPAPSDDDDEQDEEVNVALLNMGKDNHLLEDPRILKSRIKAYKKQNKNLKIENDKLRAELKKMEEMFKDEVKNLKQWNSTLRDQMAEKNDTIDNMTLELKSDKLKLKQGLAEEKQRAQTVKEKASLNEHKLRESFILEIDRVEEAYEASLRQIEELKSKLPPESRDVKSLRQRSPSVAKESVTPLQIILQQQPQPQKIHKPVATGDRSSYRSQSLGGSTGGGTGGSIGGVRKQIVTTEPLPAIGQTLLSGSYVPYCPSPISTTSSSSLVTGGTSDDEEAGYEHQSDIIHAPSVGARQMSIPSRGLDAMEIVRQHSTLPIKFPSETLPTVSKEVQTNLTLLALNKIMQIVDHPCSPPLGVSNSRIDVTSLNHKHKRSVPSDGVDNKNGRMDVRTVYKVIEEFMRSTLADLNKTCAEMEQDKEKMKAKLSPAELKQLRLNVLSRINPNTLLNNNPATVDKVRKSTSSDREITNPEESLHNFVKDLTTKSPAAPLSDSQNKSDSMYKDHFNQLEKHVVSVIGGVDNLTTYRIHCLQVEKEELAKMLSQSSDLHAEDTTKRKQVEKEELAKMRSQSSDLHAEDTTKRKQVEEEELAKMLSQSSDLHAEDTTRRKVDSTDLIDGDYDDSSYKPNNQSDANIYIEGHNMKYCSKPYNQKLDSTKHNMQSLDCNKHGNRRTSNELRLTKATMTKKGLLQIDANPNPIPTANQLAPWESVTRLNEELRTSLVVQDPSSTYPGQISASMRPAFHAPYFMKLGRGKRKKNKIPKSTGNKGPWTRKAGNMLDGIPDPTNMSDRINMSDGIPNLTNMSDRINMSDGIPNLTNMSDGIPNLTNMTDGIPNLTNESFMKNKAIEWDQTLHDLNDFVKNECLDHNLLAKTVVWLPTVMLVIKIEKTRGNEWRKKSRKMGPRVRRISSSYRI